MPTKAKLKTAPKQVSKPAKPTKLTKQAKPGKAKRSTRVEARLTPENLTVLRRAAEIQGRSLSDFIVSAAREIAHRTIEETQIIRLSVEQQRQIADALINPPPPTPALIRAFEHHRRLIRSSGG
jgi:uncharacterized protein (DUF1778 family)